MLEIKNLHVAINGTKVLKGINLKLEKGKVYALMGPNGSGKTTLAHTIMGNPKYEVIKGKIILNGEEITNLSPDKRAKKGIFMSFQHPQQISGISVRNFLRTTLNNVKNKRISLLEFRKLLKQKMELLELNESFAERYLNEGFSGGEKKKCEILQLLMINPKIAILDETDSGLDVDALKTVAKGIKSFMKKDKTILLITHYKRILNYVKPDEVLIMINGEITMKGGLEIVDELEEKGYSGIK